MVEGRWPANVIIDPALAEVIDKQSGTRKDGVVTSERKFSGWAKSGELEKSGKTFGGEGGASRFFLNAGYEPWELEWIYANGLRPCGE